MDRMKRIGYWYWDETRSEEIGRMITFYLYHRAEVLHDDDPFRREKDECKEECPPLSMSPEGQ